MNIRLALVEDHLIVRQGLRAVLENETDLEVVGEASNGPQALRLVEELKPDVLIVDLMMPGMGGLEVSKWVAERYPATRVVILSMHADVAYVAESIRAGALGYVLKVESSKELVRAIREAAAGRRCISPSISEESLRAYEERSAGVEADPLHSLTLREQEVLRLTAQGHSGAEIGEQLFISPRTVETHRANLMRKLGVRNQKELVRFAVERGLISE